MTKIIEKQTDLIFEPSLTVEELKKIAVLTFTDYTLTYGFWFNLLHKYINAKYGTVSAEALHYALSIKENDIVAAFEYYSENYNAEAVEKALLQKLVEETNVTLATDITYLTSLRLHNLYAHVRNVEEFNMKLFNQLYCKANKLSDEEFTLIKDFYEFLAIKGRKEDIFDRLVDFIKRINRIYQEDSL